MYRIRTFRVVIREAMSVTIEVCSSVFTSCNQADNIPVGAWAVTISMEPSSSDDRSSHITELLHRVVLDTVREQPFPHDSRISSLPAALKLNVSSSMPTPQLSKYYTYVAGSVLHPCHHHYVTLHTVDVRSTYRSQTNHIRNSLLGLTDGNIAYLKPGGNDGPACSMYSVTCFRLRVSRCMSHSNSSWSQRTMCT